MNDDSKTGEIINSLARFGVSDKMLLLCTWIIDKRWTMELSFEKWENGKWYVVFPDYDGDQEDLEMVDGADKFLDVLTTDGLYVNLRISLEYDPDMYHLHLVKHDELGGTYEVMNHGRFLHKDIWLCNVIHDVIGEHPEDIWFKLL